MPSWLTANRVAAAAAFLTGIATALAGIAGAVPGKAGQTITAAVGVIGSIITVLHFMSGSQKYDALTVNTEPTLPTGDQEMANTPDDEVLTGKIPTAVVGDNPDAASVHAPAHRPRKGS